MRLTPRCRDLLRFLHAARWATTAQLHRRFFSAATLDAARKRLRKLAGSDYLFAVQDNRMSQLLFTVGREGKRVLEIESGSAVALERRPPKQAAHFLGINDIRIAAERFGSLSYFFASWELAALQWAHPVIPDAVFAVGDRAFAVEFDRGVEGLQFFLRTKMPTYRRGFDGFPLTAVLVVTDREARMTSLARAIGDARGSVLFSTLDAVRDYGFSAPIFHRGPEGKGVPLV